MKTFRQRDLKRRRRSGSSRATAVFCPRWYVEMQKMQKMSVEMVTPLNTVRKLTSGCMQAMAGSWRNCSDTTSSELDSA